MRKRGTRVQIGFAVLLLGALTLAQTARGAENCPVTHDQLVQALKKSVKPSGGPTNGGFDNNEWAAVANRGGTVCAIAFSGKKSDDQWPGSRAIAAEKANTANNFSVDKMALSTANLYAEGQPGGPLFGMLTSDPVNGAALHAGKPSQYGTASDPLIGKHIGGVIVFGGGRALYSDKGIVGALGAGGDTSCADHNIAWRIRKAVGLNKVPAGVAGTKKDAIIYDIGADGKCLSGYGHPTCGLLGPAIAADIGAGFVPNGVT
jgi:uncharacterized protein GlcG (DUF336 family)